MGIPFAVSMSAAYKQSFLLATIAIVMMFILAGILPFAHRRESLWVFIMAAIVFVPVNWLLVTKYGLYRYLLLVEEGQKFYKVLFPVAVGECMVILSCLEEILAGLAARVLWRKQAKLYVPGKEGGES